MKFNFEELCYFASEAHTHVNVSVMKCGEYELKIYHCEVSDDGSLWSPSGVGKTLDEAASKLFSEINNQSLVFNAYCYDRFDAYANKLMKEATEESLKFAPAFRRLCEGCWEKALSNVCVARNFGKGYTVSLFKGKSTKAFQIAVGYAETLNEAAESLINQLSGEDIIFHEGDNCVNIKSFDALLVGN